LWAWEPDWNAPIKSAAELDALKKKEDFARRKLREFDDKFKKTRTLTKERARLVRANENGQWLL